MPSRKGQLGRGRDRGLHGRGARRNVSSSMWTRCAPHLDGIWIPLGEVPLFCLRVHGLQRWRSVWACVRHGRAHGSIPLGGGVLTSCAREVLWLSCVP